MGTITYTVTVASAKFTIDDAVAPKLTFRDGDTYVFDQADSSNSGHILQFSITSNNSGASEYTTGVTKTGTPGSAGAKTTIITSSSTTDTIYYYSSGGGTHGEEFSNSGFNTSTTYNLLKPIVGAETTAEKWGPMINHSIDQISEKFTALDAIPAYDDNVIQTNIAMLGFKVAVNGSLAKYDLQDQIVDEYVSNAGVDGTPSTNHNLTSGVYSGITPSVPPAGGNSTDTSVSGYTIRVFTGSGALTVVTGGNVSILVVGGGGSGGTDYGGGGGAGGLVYDAVYAVTANTYDMVIGDGGDGQTAIDTNGDIGDDTTVTINTDSVMQFTAKGGGFGGGESNIGGPGGSGGGNSYANSTNQATTQAAQDQPGMAGDVGVNIGYAGGSGSGAPGYNTGGGGGAGGAGDDGDVNESGIGGIGENYGTIFGTAVGHGGWFASGGGGGWIENGNSVAGTASSGGGTAGGTPMNGDSSPALDNTGGGSGGGASTYGNSGDGGSGVVLVKYANADFVTTYEDMTLQSIDTAAEAEPDYADMVMLIEDSGGTPAVLNTDIMGFISEDSGVTFTKGDLVDEGDWGTNKRILAFHDLDISAQNNSGNSKSMCYKITTHNQSASKVTKIHATSIGWR